MSDSITKKDVIAHIFEHKKSNFKSHFFTFFHRKKHLVGEVKSDEILLWKTNYWISGGFPVFKLEFNENDELIHITSTKNEFAKYSNFILFVPIISLILFSLLKIDFSLASLILPFLLILILLALYFITGHIYSYEKKQLLIELYETLDIEYKEERKKEYSFWKLLLRLVMYPLTIILIALFTSVIPDSPLLGIGGLIFTVPYIVSDILILIKYNKK